MNRSFGAYLKRLRDAKRMTQRDLASEVGVSFTYLSKLENEAQGFETSSESMLERLAEALGADPDEMLARAGKVPSDVQRILIEDFSLIKAIRAQHGDGSVGEDNE